MKIERHKDCFNCGQPRIVMTLTDDEALLLRSALRYQNSVSRTVHVRLDAMGVKRTTK